MTHIASATKPPRRLLFATNLTSRADRALERALQLAREWDAGLHVVHVVEERPPAVPVGVNPERFLARYPDPKVEATRQLRRDLGPDRHDAVVHVVEAQAPAAAILEVARREECDLIVLGETRPGLFAPLENTLEQIVRTSPVSVLAVRDRAHGPYAHVLVGTDFTDEAQQALVAAAGLFPQAAITLMHVHSMPYAYLLEGTPDGLEWPERQLAKLQAQVASAELPPERQSEIRSAVESGSPAAMMSRYALEKGTDLTVIGAHPRGMLFDAVVGNSRRIVDAIPGDLLMVRARS